MFELDSPIRQRRRTVAFVLGALAAASALSSQEPNSKPNSVPNPAIVLRQTVRRVRVDVIVTDAQGHAVPNLRAADFRVDEDGKPQPIRQFEWHGAETAKSATPTRPALRPHTFMNLPEAPEHGPLTVLLYDVLNTPLNAQDYARMQMVDFLKKNTGQQIAIFVLSDRLHLLQGFTSDTDLLERAASSPGSMPQRPALQAVASPQTGELVDAVADQGDKAAQQIASNPGAMGAQHAMDGTIASLQHLADTMAHMEAAESSALLDRRVDITLDAFAQVGRFLAGVEGRKNLIWFSGSFPAAIGPNPNTDPISPGDIVRHYSDRLRAASDLLNTAQVAVYPVESRGLKTNPFFDALQATPSGGVGGGQKAALKAASDFSNETAGNHGAMDQMAEQTGGRAFYNTNGLTEALSSAAADGSAYYTLLYAPTNPKFDGSVRRIKIRLQPGGYRLAYRKSYFADDLDSGAHPLTAVEDEQKAAVESMRAASQFGAPAAHQLIFAAQVDAVGAPAPATQEQMKMLTPYLEQAAKAEHRRFVQPSAPVQLQAYAIQYAVLASQLDLPLSAANVYRPRLSLAALAFSADGAILYGNNTRIEGAIRACTIDKVTENGYQVMQVFLVPVETAVLRLVVRDEHSGRLGSMEIHLPLPQSKQAAAPTH